MESVGEWSLPLLLKLKACTAHATQTWKEKYLHVCSTIIKLMISNWCSWKWEIITLKKRECVLKNLPTLISVTSPMCLSSHISCGSASSLSAISPGPEGPPVALLDERVSWNDAPLSTWDGGNLHKLILFSYLKKKKRKKIQSYFYKDLNRPTTKSLIGALINGTFIPATHIFKFTPNV